MTSTSITSCDYNRSRCRRQVVKDESKTIYINPKNANGVKYFESPESSDPLPESVTIQTQSLSMILSNTYVHNLFE
jgi:hypothetical protein